MLKDQCIPVTDLRTETKKCLKNMEKEPIAGLVDIVEYENNFLRPRLVELKENEVDEATKKQALKAKKSKRLGDI